MIANIFEACMVICFGLSWPFNIIKSVKTKSTKGKSIVFLSLIEIGYICGIICKIILGVGSNGNPVWVFVIYVINLTMVTVDLVLYFINRAGERKAQNRQGNNQ